jgi:hypothetical protein
MSRPETATITISPAVLLPVLTVTVVDVVLRIGASRTKTERTFAEVPQKTAPILV